MGRSPCCEHDVDVKKGPWATEEDKMLNDYIEKNGPGNWRQLPKQAGLNRCGKSCRLRWMNYLRPDIKRGMFSEEEERLIIHFHSVLGNKWSQIAAQLPGRTDNEIKNYWNTHLRKKLLRNGIDPLTHRQRTDLNPLGNLSNRIAAAVNLNNFTPNPFVDAFQLQKLQLFQTLVQIITSGSSTPNTDSTSLLGSPFVLQNLNQPLLEYHNTDFRTLLGSLNYGSCNSSDFGFESSAGAGAGANNTNANSSFMTTQMTNSMPSLVPNSPENFLVNQALDLVNLPDVVSGSSDFESWSGLTLDDLNIDLGWKDILEQMSWPNPSAEMKANIVKSEEPFVDVD